MPGYRKLADLKRELRAVNQAIAALERLKQMRNGRRVTQHHYQVLCCCRLATRFLPARSHWVF